MNKNKHSKNTKCNCNINYYIKIYKTSLPLVIMRKVFNECANIIFFHVNIYLSASIAESSHMIIYSRT